MIPIVALCADETSMCHPELIGLAGEHFAAQTWLRLFSSGEEIRTFLRSDHAVGEVWIVSCDDVEPINLAATLKGDRGDLRVCLVSFQGTGSLRSRASAAGVDAMLTRQAFVTRYIAFKRARSSVVHLPEREGASAGIRSSGLLLQPEEPKLAPPDLRDFDEPAAPGRSGVEASSIAQNIQGGAPEPPPGFARQDEAVFASAASASSSTPISAVSSSAGLPTSSSASTIQPGVFPVTPGASTDALLLPIVSGSGGAGKSAVAVLSALLSQKRGLKTLLLDFDLQFGDMREMAGASDALGVDEVLADPGRLAQLASLSSAPAVLAAPHRLEEAEPIAQSAPALLDALGGMFDVIVANTGASWAEQHAVLLERCSKALFLIDQRASSLAACRRALDLCARCGIAVSPFLFAVNFCAKGAPITSIDASCALRGVQTVELADGGAEVEEALSEGRPHDLIESGNPFVQSLDGLLAGILPTADIAVAEGIGGSVRGSRRKRRRRRRRGSS